MVNHNKDYLTLYQRCLAWLGLVNQVCEWNIKYFWNISHSVTELIAAPRTKKTQTAWEIVENSRNLFSNSEIYYLKERKKGNMKALDLHVLHWWNNKKRLVQDGKSQGLCVINDTSRIPVYCQQFDCFSNCGGAKIRESKTNPPPTMKPESFSKEIRAPASKHAIDKLHIDKQKPFQISMWFFYSWQWALNGFWWSITKDM